MAAGGLVCTLGKQKGVALLVLLIFIILAASSYFISGLSINQVKVDQKNVTQEVLKKAKDALIAYVVTSRRLNDNLGKFGKLPCPDHADTALEEGEQDSSCGNAYANGIGYFPWRTLGVETLKDGSGNCLLYAVSPGYKANPFAALNPDSYGQFQMVDDNGAVVIGDSAGGRPVAVIIAPGGVLASQNRSFDDTTICGFDYDTIKNDLGAYLDNDGTTNNAALDTGVDNFMDQFVQIYASSASAVNPINDRFVIITYDEIWDEFQSIVTDGTFDNKMRNLTEAIAICFAGYGLSNNNHLPMPALMDLGGNEYRKDSDYLDSGDFTAGFAGRLPYDLERAKTEMLSGDLKNIFDNNYCDGIDLVTTATVVENINFSDDAGSDNGEYFDIWRNWKDHFFYAVSQAHKPSTIAVAGCSVDCVSVGVVTNEYAGIVLFSGLKQAVVGQERYTSIFDSLQTLDGDDDKDDIVNYLEGNRDNLFPDNTGNGIYDAVAPGSNDIMFCINTDMSVEAC